MNFRFIRLYLKTLLVRKIKIILAVFLVIGILALLTLRLSSVNFNTRPQTLSVGLIGNFTENDLPSEASNLISLGLTKIDDSGKAQPSLAEKWETADNGREYVFTLNKGLKWQDGKIVRAKDLKLNFSEIQTEILADDVIKFRLKDPLVSFPTIMAKPFFKDNLVGMGQFRVTSIEKNGNNLKNISLVGPGGETFIFRFYPQESVAKTALKLGEIQVLKTQKFKQETKDGDLVNLKTTSYVNPDQYLGLFFSARDPFLSEKTNRQALLYAIGDDLKQATTSPLSYNSWAFNKEVRFYKYDLAHAKELLGKSKFEGEKKITLTTVPLHQDCAQEIKDAWEKLGVKTDVQILPAIPSQFQTLLISQEIPKDPDQYSLWHSTQVVTNITGYDSKRIDKLLEDGRKIQNTDERKQIYEDFQRVLVEDAPAGFLYYPEVIFYYYPKVEKQLGELQKYWQS